MSAIFEFTRSKRTRKMSKIDASDNIDDSFFDKNDWLEEVFYDFNQKDDHPVLQIGGEKWKNYKIKQDWTTKKNNDDEIIIQNKLLTSFSHSNVLKDELTKWKNQQQKTEWQIVISDIVLDDWKSLFFTLIKHEITITKLVLGDQRNFGANWEWLKCYFSEMGFETLIWVLNPRQSGIRIQRVDFEAICVSKTIGKKCMPLFCALPIKRVELKSGPSWFESLFRDHRKKVQRIYQYGNVKFREDGFEDDRYRYGAYLVMSMEMKKVVELPEKMDDDFFEKNEMGRRFYDFDECNNGARLTIGGRDWQQCIFDYDWNEEIMVVESKLYEAFIRSNFLREQLMLKKWNIEFGRDVWSHDWKSLLLAFSKHNFHEHKILLSDFKYGEEAQTLKWLWDTGFQVEEVNQHRKRMSIKFPKTRETNTTTSNEHHFIKRMMIDFDWETDLLDTILSSTRVGSLNIRFGFYDDWDKVSSASVSHERWKRCLAWVTNLRQSPRFQIEKMNFNAFVDDVQRKEWVHDILEIPAKYIKASDLPATFFPFLIQQRRLQSLVLGYAYDGGESLDLEMEVWMDREPSESNVSNDENHFIPEVEFCPSYDRYNPDECDLIQEILCHFHVGCLKVGHLPEHGLCLDFFVGAKGCREIEIESLGIFLSDCDGLASMIHEDGYLKKLCFREDNCIDDPEQLGWFLDRADFSFLDTFEIEFCLNHDRDAFSVFCRHLKENKGPRCLKIRNRWDYNREESAINETLEELGASLCGNTKIEQLNIDFLKIDVNDPAPSALLQFIERVVCDMPRLSSFEFEVLGKEEEDKIIWRMTNDEQESQKRIVLRRIVHNKKIQHLRLPFDDEGLGQMSDEIPKYRDLLRCGNEVSDGIWSHAMSHIKIMAPSLMYHVVQQVPRLFQPQSKDDDDDAVVQQPMFTVLHHPNCPACRAQKSLWLINEQPQKKKRRVGEE